MQYQLTEILLCLSVVIATLKNFFFYMWAGEVAQRAKELSPARSDNLSSIPRVHMVERTNSQKLSSTSTCPLWHTLAHKINKQT